jgi:hypothetical protein
MNTAAPALVAIVFGLLASATAQAMKLVSLEGLNIEKAEYMAAFKVETWAIQIRVVCNIPASWMITAGKELNAGGRIKASGFMANLAFKQMDELKDLFLIDDPDFDHRPSPSEPPMFRGSITIGSYDPSLWAKERVVPLKVGSIILRDATQCPAPSNRGTGRE